MFVSSEAFVEAHGGRIGDISVYGQESNPTTWRLCKMNLAIRGIEGNVGPHAADSFLSDQHPDLRADFILANPPFNMKEWGADQLQKDVRWKYGIPPRRNANFAWMQHMIHHLAPSGTLGLVLANGSMSSNTGGEGDIRKAIVEADLVDCMVALPGQLFYTTQIPVCLWFLARNKNNDRHRDRRGETLFIDARQMGEMVDRTHRELTLEEITEITATYHAWRDGSPLPPDEIQARSFAGLLQDALDRYNKQQVAALEILNELIKIAQEMRQAHQRGDDLGLNEDETAFYDALADNQSAVEVLGDEKLAFIARELIKVVRQNVSIDWTVKQSARAKIRIVVKRILRKYGYPPDLQETATNTVLEQAELLAAEWT